jgi:putative phosphoribosyl transferase
MRRLNGAGAERFRDRKEAGRLLAERLAGYRERDGLLVLGLPRGGVPVAAEVARALGAPLDVFLVRKLGFPGQEELAMGAIASGGARALNEELLRSAPLPPEVIEEVAAREEVELRRRELLYRGERPPLDPAGRTLILVDDGVATGSSMRAAVAALRTLGAEQIVVAVPVAPPQTCEILAREADEVVCLRTPRPFYAVGLWYSDFSEVTDEQVRDLLATFARGTVERPFSFAAGGATLEGSIAEPAGARGIVLFAHGSGSSRFSPRNHLVASTLQERGLATVLVDLLTAEEEEADRRGAHLRFDVGLLGGRVLAAMDRVSADEEVSGLPLGLFGASTGAAAALLAAAERPAAVRAVVSRGGRPDLAADALARVAAPTLLIVGELDDVVLGLNREAAARLGGPVELEIVPGASHLFEEPGALDDVARLAAAWFGRHLG